MAKRKLKNFDGFPEGDFWASRSENLCGTPQEMYKNYHKCSFEPESFADTDKETSLGHVSLQRLLSSIDLVF